MVAIDTDIMVRARYAQGPGIFRIIPAAVCRPRSADELRGALAVAAREGWPVTIRGAGSAMDGSSLGPGLVVDMREYDRRVCDVSSATRTATAAPGVTVRELNAAARPHGLHFPVDPSSSNWATLGGVVSTNAAGAHTLQNGSVRQWVAALTLETLDGPLVLTRGVTPDAQHPVVRRWQRDGAPVIARVSATIRARYPRVRKNSAGFALDRYLDTGELIDIVTGSEGTLGAITSVTLRLDAIIPERVSLRVALRDRGDLPEVIARLMQHHPATIELLDRTFLRLVAEHIPPAMARSASAAGWLLVDFEGDKPDRLGDIASAAAESVRQIALETDIAVAAEEIASLWEVRHRASPILAGLTDGRRSLQVIEDGCVPVSRLGEYLDAVERAGQRHGVDLVMFGHAGDGHVHVNLLPDVTRGDWLDRVRAVYREVSAAVIALGGTPSGEHGAGRLRGPLLDALYGRDITACFTAIRRAFDPDGRWNAGLWRDVDPFDSLKVGAAAPPLPGGVAEELAAIERDGQWGAL